MTSASLSRRDASLPQDIQREIEKHDTQLRAIYRMVETAARQHDQTGAAVTVQAVAELERLAESLARSNIPEEQKARLQARIDEAFAVHDRLLAEAEAEAVRRVREVAAKERTRKRSPLDALGEEIGKTLDELADGLFRR
jgi:hypothetical protein